MTAMMATALQPTASGFRMRHVTIRLGILFAVVIVLAAVLATAVREDFAPSLLSPGGPDLLRMVV